MPLPHQKLNTSHDFVAAVPDDATFLENVRAVWVGGIGDLVLENWDGADVTFTLVAAPVTIECSPRRILETTTATNIVLFY